jgi:hypothetical protein
MVVVDGKVLGFYTALLRGTTLFFDADGALHWLAVNDLEILQATAKMK